MSDVENIDPIQVELDAYESRCAAAFQVLFERARAQQELQFALALSPEMRGMQGAGWSTASEASRALDEYLELLEQLPRSPIKMRVAMGLYSNICEASGYYEVPKNMLRIAGGDWWNMRPFDHLVPDHGILGVAIAPNANKIMRDLIGHARQLGLEDFIACINEMLDADLRNAYAHADYIVSEEGFRLRRRNGGLVRVVPYDEFFLRLNKALTLFQVLRQQISNFVRTYIEPKVITGFLNSDQQVTATLQADPDRGTFTITSTPVYEIDPAAQAASPGG